MSRLWKRWKQVGFNSPLAWLVLFVLLIANVATLSVLWVLIGGEGAVSEALSSPNASFDLPEATQAAQPTTTATQVFDYQATATKTPTLQATPTLTVATATPVPVAPTPTEPPPVKIEYVVIISVDGLRPDALDLTDTPALDNLRTNGAYSAHAKAILPSNTMPNHASMLGGMTPDKHGILWNLPYAEAPHINGPTLFSVAHEAGLSTAMVVGKAKLEYLVIDNSVDQFIGNDLFDDMTVKNQAITVIGAGLPNILFIHFPQVDTVGHDAGWLSPGQLQTVTTADGFIGEIVAALKTDGYLDRTLIIVTADHGGSGTGHGSDSPEDTTIPWLAVGPGVPAGLTLTQDIVTYDTAATALHALEIPLPDTWDGQPVLEIFQ